VVCGGQGKGSLGVWVPPSMLVSGENLVSFEAQGGEMDMSVVDRIGLRYFRRYRTDDEALSFRAEGGQRVVVKGFEGSPVRVMDITDPRGICQLKGRVKSRSSGYAVKVKVADVGQRRLFAFSSRQIKEPFEIRSNVASSWHGEDNGADLVIIAHGDFMGGLDSLAALRESQGFSVAVVDVEDLYDEFGFGAKSARAIRDFLSRAYALWDLPPRYVLFVGDASFDPRNHLGLGDYDFVPTMTLNTEYLETASDDWFGDMDEDGLADMAIGRLPVRTMEEALSMVEKMIAYEQEEQGSDVVLVADAFDGSFDFEGACLDVEELIPPELAVWEIFRGRSPTARGDLLDKLGNGALLVNYVGHGSSEIWNGGLFNSADALALTNGSQLPFFVNMTCLNGLFHDLYTQCLAEGLMKAQQGGAVAVWASSGLCQPAGQAEMNQELARLLFGEEPVTLGEAAMWAKEATEDPDVRKTWILFGDPTTRLK
jgi:hypothetical protein